MLRKALDEYHVVGVSTNVEFLRTLAGNQAFINEEVETGFIPKHFDELFPPIPAPSPELLAQAALFVVLRDHPVSSPMMQSPWTSLASRRFGGDVYERTITLQEENAASDSVPITVLVKSAGPAHFHVTVRNQNGETHFKSVSAQLISPTTLSSTVNDEYARVTVVSQPPAPTMPATSASNTMERLHVFRGGAKTTLVLPSPKWLLSLSEDILSAAKGALRAPMPSLVVEVRVKLGERVEKGQAVIVLESMKTETVLRADVSGVVKAVGCKNGEMVEEGRELVEIGEDWDAV